MRLLVWLGENDQVILYLLSNSHIKRCRGIVVMDFNCYTAGDRGSIPAQGDSLGKWMNLRLGQPMPYEGNWVVSPRCWRDIDLQSVYNCENGLLSLLQFNHIEIETNFLKFCWKKKNMLWVSLTKPLIGVFCDCK